MYGNSLYYFLNFSVYLNLLWKNKVLFCFCFFQYSLMQTGRPGQSCFTQQAGHLSGWDPLRLPALLAWPGPTAAKPSHGCETTAAVSVRPADDNIWQEGQELFLIVLPCQVFSPDRRPWEVSPGDHWPETGDMPVTEPITEKGTRWPPKPTGNRTSPEPHSGGVWSNWALPAS